MSCENETIQNKAIYTNDLIPEKKDTINADRCVKKIEESLINCVSQPPKMSILMDTSVKQLCNKQDAVIYVTIDEKEGVTKETGDLPIDILSVMDGHGKDIVPNIVKGLDFEYHFKQRNTPESIQQAIISKCNEMKAISDKNSWLPSKMSYKEYAAKRVSIETMIRSGTTYSAAYMQRNETTGVLKVVLEWVGDSPIFVFVNGEKVFEAITHHANNEQEIDLMKAKGFITGIEKSDVGFKVISHDTIVNEPGKYAILKGGNGSQLACTRSLGHNGITCTEAETAIIVAKMTDEVKVIVMSDGVGDMLHIETDMEKLKTYSAEELVDLAETRWKQTWNYHGSKTQFSENGYDDCSAAVWWQKPADQF